MERKVVNVRGPHNLSFVAETGSSLTPVIPKNNYVSFFLANTATKKFLGGARSRPEQG